MSGSYVLNFCDKNTERCCIEIVFLNVNINIIWSYSMSCLYNSDKMSITIIHAFTTHTFKCIDMHLKTLHIAHYNYHFLSMELFCDLTDMTIFYSCQKYWIISYQYAHPPRMFIENCNMFKSNKLCRK